MGVRVDYANGIRVDDIDTIYITGGGYVREEFYGIDRESAMGWQEAVWGADLNRSKNRVLTNIDKVEFGFVARCEISFKYMNIDKYLKLMQIARQRTCYVDYYSRDLGRRVTQEMAFTNTELGKLYTIGKDHLGSASVTIKLVATNRDDEMVNLIKSNFTISYNNNGGSGSISSVSGIKYASEYEISNGTAFTKSGYSLKGFNTKADGSGWAYLPNQRITVFDNMTLYAQWQQA